MTWDVVRWALIGLVGVVLVAVAVAEPGMAVFGFIGGVLAVVAFVKVVRLVTDRLADRT